MDEIVATALATPRFNSAVMVWFGAAGLLFWASGRGLRLAAIGAAIGVGAAWLGDSVLRSALPDSQPSDLSTFVIPVGSVLAVALLASYIPARRATRIDPVAALRIE